MPFGPLQIVLGRVIFVETPVPGKGTYGVAATYCQHFWLRSFGASTSR
jgi:hypothetical protein